MFTKFLCVLLIVPAAVLGVTFSPCDNHPQPLKVNIENCGDEFCLVKRSAPANMQLTFESPKEIESATTAAAHAQFAGSWLPWGLGEQAKVCNHLTDGAKCPLKPNERVTYDLNINIPRIAPVGTKTVVEIRITDQTKEVIACTRFPVKVTA